jgi:hypothetical protein
MSLPWFAGWLRGHLRRHALLGLPAPETVPEFYEAWESELERLRIPEFVATLVSVRMVGRAKPPRVHFEQLLRTARELMPRREPERKGPMPAYEPPPPPRGAELEECLMTAMGTTPLARNMRLELRRYIMEERVNARRFPVEALDAIAAEPEAREPEPITPPRLKGVPGASRRAETR